jgi:hypothetical protein
VCVYRELDFACTRKSELAYDARWLCAMFVLCDQYVGAHSYLSYFCCLKLLKGESFFLVISCVVRLKLGMSAVTSS